MCGICGFNWKDDSLIRKMTEKIRHRGPDAQGVKTFGNVSIGNARLSIIDLSANGNQPMADESGRKWIVYNGEIYNFPDLKKDLISRGHTFRSHTDTEVVLKSYLEYGAGCLQHFIGMYAFAIWDEDRRELFIARDRLGIKPLYYYHKDGKFLFASEIKCILEADCVKREVDLQSLYHYLGYEFIPAPRTLFKNIRKLRQGHYAILRGNDLKIEKYWELDFRHAKMSEDEHAERLFGMMETAVKRWMISDVPVGVFLSGGLDSSTVTGFVAKWYGKKVQTFSIGYADKTFSELPYAKKVSDFFGTEHNVLMIDPVSPEDIEKSLYHLDEPMTDLSTIPFYLISCKAREKVKVCMSGEGGDEVFLGYDRFKAARLNRWYGLLPSWVRRNVTAPLVMRLPDQKQKKGAVNMLKRFIEGSLYPEEAGAMRWQYFMNPFIEGHIFNERAKGQITFDAFDPIRYFGGICGSNDPVEKDIFVDIKLTMADSVLMKVDKMSMATSLEVRVPFLDHELVELCATIPPHLKLKNMTTKYIMRKALKKHSFLPDDIIWRGKQGYSLPVKNWLREDLKDYMVHLLSTSPVIQENLCYPFIELLIDEHLKLKHNHNHILWALMNVAMWHKKFFE